MTDPTTLTEAELADALERAHSAMMYSEATERGPLDDQRAEARRVYNALWCEWRDRREAVLDQLAAQAQEQDMGYGPSRS